MPSFNPDVHLGHDASKLYKSISFLSDLFETLAFPFERSSPWFAHQKAPVIFPWLSKAISYILHCPILFPDSYL